MEYTQQNQPEIPREEIKSPEVTENRPRAEEHGVQVGPIIGSVIIIVILVLGGLYLLGKKVSEEGALAPEPQEIRSAPDEVRASLETQGTSDAVQSIEEDLDATPLDGLDTELRDIETELGL